MTLDLDVLAPAMARALVITDPATRARLGTAPAP
jgi:hypothetical protein